MSMIEQPGVVLYFGKLGFWQDPRGQEGRRGDGGGESYCSEGSSGEGD